jgi:hypothetical protein
LKFFKFLLIAGLIFYGVYWVSTSGVAWWQTRQIKQSVKAYYEEEGYYPLNLKQLTNQTYETQNGETQKYLSDIPIPRSGYCWEYNSDNGNVKLEPSPEDFDLDDRVCP